jgi:hypothetical protein
VTKKKPRLASLELQIVCVGAMENFTRYERTCYTCRVSCTCVSQSIVRLSVDDLFLERVCDKFMALVIRPLTACPRIEGNENTKHVDAMIAGLN